MMARSSGRTSRALGWVRCKPRWVLVRSWSAMPAAIWPRTIRLRAIRSGAGMRVGRSLLRRQAGTVYITNGGDVVAIDHLTGIQRWRFTPADFSPVTNTPAVGPGVVYVTGG